MKNLTIKAAAASAATLAMLWANAAYASEEGPGFCDSEVQECAPTPTPTPSAPYLPTQGISTNGNYFIELGTIQNQQVQQGYYIDGNVGYFGGGALKPAGGDGSLTVTGLDTSITLAPVISPLASASVIASATPAQSTQFPDFGLAARGGILVSYLVVLHAQDQAAANALSSVLSSSGAIATISGNYDVNGTDSFWASVSAQTGVNELDASLGGIFSKQCSLIGYQGTPDGCGAGSYELPLNFVSASLYQDGSPLDFISAITLSADANAGPVDLGYYIGTAHAFIDPTITLGKGIDASKYTLTTGIAPTPFVAGTVPEPASWALMIGGFALVGGLSRRARMRPALAV